MTTSPTRAKTMLDKTLTIEQAPDETGAQALARAVPATHVRHTLGDTGFAGSFLPSDPDKPGVMDYVKEYRAATAPLSKGDLAQVSEVLASARCGWSNGR